MSDEPKSYPLSAFDHIPSAPATDNPAHARPTTLEEAKETEELAANDETGNRVRAVPDIADADMAPAWLMVNSEGRFVPAPEMGLANAPEVLAVLDLSCVPMSDPRRPSEHLRIAFTPTDLRLLKQQMEHLIAAAEEAGVL